MSTNEQFLVIFDMNGVLLTKDTQWSPYFDEKAVSTQSRTVSLFHPNIDLETLAKFYKTHSFKIGMWTTVTHRNAKSPYLHLTRILGFDFDCFFTQEDCSLGEMVGNIKTPYCVKDLRKPASFLGISTDNCLLVDDSEAKRFGTQNHFLFNSFERDMLRCIKAIDKFIGCEDCGCIAKTL